MLRAKILGLAGAAATGSYLSYQIANPVIAEAIHTKTTSHHKKSAYENSEASMYIVPEPPSALQQNITVARKFVVQKIKEADSGMRRAVDVWIGVEQDVERTIKEIAPKHERLLPGAIYVAVTGMSGSILARNRSLPIRFFSPILLALFSAQLFLPETTGNVGKLIWRYEQKIPEVAIVHQQVSTHVGYGMKKVEQTLEDGRHLVEGAVEGSRGFLENQTGMPLKGRRE